MSAIKLFIVLLFFNTLQAQDWEGVYKGSLISKENAISISVLTKTMAFGTLYLNRDDKKFFNAVIDEQGLGAKIKLDAKEYELMAVLDRDSLRVTLYSIVKDSAVERYRGNFLRVSHDPKHKISKVLAESKGELNPRLIGKWRLIKFIYPGKEITPDETFETEYAVDGEMKTISAMRDQLERQYRRMTGKTFENKSMTWRTSENKLITTNKETGKSSTQTFVIAGDTLIVKNDRGMTSYSLRKK